jgi:hypothetical protein
LNGGITSSAIRIYGEVVNSREKKPERPAEPPYWTHDTSLFTGNFRYFGKEPVLVRGKVHLADELYRKSDVDLEIVPLTHKQGMSTYANLRAYVLVPDITLTVELYPAAIRRLLPDAIGEVAEVTEKPKPKEQHVGDGQAWYYPADRTIVLWECSLYEHFRKKSLTDREPIPITEDTNMHGLWTGFEQFLTAQFPDAVQIATTHSDPAYETEQYQEFLTNLGYSAHPTAKAAWSKALQHAP